MLKLLENYEEHFKKRMEFYWNTDEKFYQEYYGYLRVIQDLKAHIKAGKTTR